MVMPSIQTTYFSELATCILSLSLFILDCFPTNWFSISNNCFSACHYNTPPLSIISLFPVCHANLLIMLFLPFLSSFEEDYPINSTWSLDVLPYLNSSSFHSLFCLWLFSYSQESDTICLSSSYHHYCTNSSVLRSTLIPLFLLDE